MKNKKHIKNYRAAALFVICLFLSGAAFGQLAVRGKAAPAGTQPNGRASSGISTPTAAPVPKPAENKKTDSDGKKIAQEESEAAVSSKANGPAVEGTGLTVAKASGSGSSGGSSGGGSFNSGSSGGGLRGGAAGGTTTKKTTTTTFYRNSTGSSSSSSSGSASSTDSTKKCTKPDPSKADKACANYRLWGGLHYKTQCQHEINVYNSGIDKYNTCMKNSVYIER